jgi:hypothetical protein
MQPAADDLALRPSNVYLPARGRGRPAARAALGAALHLKNGTTPNFAVEEERCTEAPH